MPGEACKNCIEFDDVNIQPACQDCNPEDIVEMVLPDLEHVQGECEICGEDKLCTIFKGPYHITQVCDDCLNNGDQWIYDRRQ